MTGLPIKFLSQFSQRVLCIKLACSVREFKASFATLSSCAVLGSQLQQRFSTANSRQLTDDLEAVDSSLDERSLQVDLAHLDRAVPIAGCVGS